MLIKDLNYFERYKEAERLEKNVSKATVVKTFVIVAIVIGTFLSVSILQVLKLELQNEVTRVESYIHSQSVKNQLAEIDKKKKQLDGVTNYYKGIVVANYNINTHVQPDKVLVDSIVELLPTGTIIKEWIYGAGNISLSLIADDEDKLAQFLHNLRSHEKIYAIGYNGFQTLSQTEYSGAISIGLIPGGDADE